MNLKKKFLYIFSLSCLVISSSLSYAKVPEEYSTFYIDGKPEVLAIADIDIDKVNINRETSGADPVVINNRTLVPIRAIGEKLGYKVDWQPAIKKITIENDKNKLELNLENPVARVNNEYVMMPDNVSPKAISDRTYVPIRFVAEKMNLSIDYDAKTNKTSMKSEIGILPKENKKDYDFLERPKEPEKPKEPQLPKLPEIETIKPDVQQIDKKEDEKNTDLQKELASSIDKVKLEMPSNTRINIKTENNNIDSSYFFLSNPKRLVVDIKNAKISDNQSTYRNFDSVNFIDEKNIYNVDGNYTRFTITLPENAKNEQYAINTDGKQMSIEKLNIVKTGEAIKYSFDRKHGSITVNTDRLFRVENSSFDPSVVTLKIPKDSINLSNGDISLPQNRMVHSIKIESEGNDFDINIKLFERVEAKIRNITDTTAIIDLEKKDRQVPVIVIDPGHGGKDSGAVNREVGTNEKTLNLQVGLKLREKLKEEGYIVYMSRDDDTFVPLNDIASKANMHDPDIFISIHHNSADSRSANGIETFYYVSQDSKRLATLIFNHLIEETGATKRSVNSMPFVVVKKTTSPATLLELGFVTNNNEVRKNMSENYQNLEVKAIVDAVNEYFSR